MSMKTDWALLARNVDAPTTEERFRDALTQDMGQSSFFIMAVGIFLKRHMKTMEGEESCLERALWQENNLRENVGM